MKKFLSLALAAVIAISANAKKVETQAINSVSLNAPVHLVIVPSREYSVNVVSKNVELESAVSYTVKDGVLYISAADLESLEQSGETVDVIVTAPTALDYSVGKDMEVVSTSVKRLPMMGFRGPRRPLPHFGRR